MLNLMIERSAALAELRRLAESNSTDVPTILPVEPKKLKLNLSLLLFRNRLKVGDIVLSQRLSELCLCVRLK
jgi:hypothetical protein